MKLEDTSTVVASKNGEQLPAGWVLLNLYVFIGLIGAIACAAWLFSSIGTSMYFPFEDSVGFDAIGARILFVIGACVSFVLTRLLTDWLQAHKAFQCALSALLASVGWAGLWASSCFAGGDAAQLWCSAFLLGGGFGFLYSLYGEFVCLFFYEYIRPCILGIFVGAVALCCGLALMGEAVGLALGFAFSATAVVCYVITLLLFKLQDKPQTSKAESKERCLIKWRSYLATVTASMTSGFALGILLSMWEACPFSSVILGLALLAMCVFLLVDSLRDGTVTEGLSMRLYLPFSALVVFPLLFVPDAWRFVFAVPLLCASIIPISLALSAVCKHSVMCDLSAINAFSLGRIVSFAGMALGMLLAFIGFAPAFQELIGELSVTVSVVVFMFLLIFSASFVMVEDNYPDEKRFRAVIREGGSSVLPGAPIRPIFALKPEPDVLDEMAELAAAHPDAFHAKCEIVAKRYGLSERQHEVLTMLARGRNANYITEKLVISPHTAKAHIYNVYQKVGVHSRSELMDLVEEIEVENPSQA